MKRGILFVAIFACVAFMLASCKTVPDSEIAPQEEITQRIEGLRLVPWTPLLHFIREEDRQVTFKLFGLPHDGLAAEDCRLEVAVSDCRESAVQPLEADLTTVRLPDQAAKGVLAVKIIDERNNVVVFSEDFPYAVVKEPSMDTSGHRQLNTLVTEILDAELSAEAEQELVFSAPRDGWVFISARDASSDDLVVGLDDEPATITKSTPNFEIFRNVSKGRHCLKVKGAPEGGRLVVRSVVDIFNYCPGANSFVKENGSYEWSFQEKYGLPVVNTENGGDVPETASMRRKQLGFRWLANANTVNIADGEALVKLLSENAGLNREGYDGVTCDEQFFNQPAVLARYSAGLKAYPNPNNRLIYTWIVGKPRTAGIDHEFFSASLNASESRGKLIFEAYCPTKPTEEAARTYLDDRLVDTMRKFKEYYPDVEKSTGIIFGNFNQIPILSLQHHPSVDFKYYLDMMWNVIANNPEFQGLGCAGYWGSYYADRELHRWSFMLMRHYCIEGKTTMLSDEYGFSYIPGHVRNGDFEDGFDGWAVAGNVSLDSIKGFASRSQNRWGGGDSAGDTFAVLSNVDGELSRLTQKAVNLIPGKPYCLEFCTFDVDDAKANRINPRRFGIDAHFVDGEVRMEYTPSWIHIDRRVLGRYDHNNGVARPNLHHIVFVPTKEEVTIMLDNALSKPGENLGVNFFRVTPFLPEDELD